MAFQGARLVFAASLLSIGVKAFTSPRGLGGPSLSWRVRTGGLHAVVEDVFERGMKFDFRSDRDVRFVISDLDGTLLSRNHTVGAATEEAVMETLAQGTVFIVATGKSRAGALNSLGDKLGERLVTGPESSGGVFQQGLLIYGPGGELLRELSLAPEVINKVIEFAEGEDAVSLVAYQRDELVCAEDDKFCDVMESYREPRPRAKGDLRKALIDEAETPTNKVLLMGEVADIKRVRPLLEDALKELGDDVYEVTQALPDMIEVLPKGGNKGDGVTLLLEHLGANMRATMALGDGENDVQLMKNVAIGVAMANAVDELKDVATHVTLRTNDDGGVASALRAIILARTALIEE